MITGTAYFVSYAAASKYYKLHGHDAKSIKEKHLEGAFLVGEPRLRPGDKLHVNRDEGRYYVERKEGL